MDFREIWFLLQLSYQFTMHLDNLFGKSYTVVKLKNYEISQSGNTHENLIRPEKKIHHLTTIN